MVTAVRTVVEYGHQCTVHDVPTAAQIGVLASHHALRYHLIAQHNQYQRDAVPFGVAKAGLLRLRDVLLLVVVVLGDCGSFQFNG